VAAPWRGVGGTQRGLQLVAGSRSYPKPETQNKTRSYPNAPSRFFQYLISPATLIQAGLAFS